MLLNCGAGKNFLRVPWTARRSNLSILKEISPEYSLEGLMLKLKLPIRWPSDGKNWLIGKDPDAGRDWRQEKGTTEDEMVGWHHRLDEHEFQKAPGVSEGQGSLACCSPWDRRVRHNWATEQQPGIKQFTSPVQWKCRILTTGPPGKSQQRLKL